MSTIEPIELQQKIKVIFKEMPPTKDIAIDIKKDIANIPGLRSQVLRNMPCKKCGWCCKTNKAYIDMREMQRIRKYLGITKQEFIDKYVENNSGYFYLHSPCLFLNENNECSVYSMRPDVCKIFPINYPIITIGKCYIGNFISYLNELVALSLGHDSTSAEYRFGKSTIDAFKKFGEEQAKRMNIEYKNNGYCDNIAFDRIALDSILRMYKSTKKVDNNLYNEVKGLDSVADVIRCIGLFLEVPQDNLEYYIANMPNKWRSKNKDDGNGNRRLIQSYPGST